MSQARVAAMHALAAVDAREVAIGLVIFVVSLVGSIALSAYMLCRLPEDYLRHRYSVIVLDGRPRWQRVLRAVGKNLLGALLVAAGVVMSLPGVPGQGVLTILIGVMLLDIPGKHALEMRLFSVPSVFRGINRLRARFGKPPLLPKESERGGSAQSPAAPSA